MILKNFGSASCNDSEKLNAFSDTSKIFPIKGFQATSLIDYPGNICAVIFLAGCNFRCGFCHNKDLVFNSSNLQLHNEEEILSLLSKRSKLIDGVCITGGEPTLYPYLYDFIVKIKKIGLKVKLDTNGTNTFLLSQLISERLVDYVAMDIKQCKQKYDLICGTKVDMSQVIGSVELLKISYIDYEFRTTFVPELISWEDIVEISKWLNGAKRYVLQQFVPMHSLINPRLTKTVSEADLKMIIERVKPCFGIVEVRGH
jgi:pyruvate formate lyase activating enzyme